MTLLATPKVEFFTFFLFINVFFIRHEPHPITLVALSVLVLVAVLNWKKSPALMPVLYYIIMSIVLYVVVFGEVIEADSVFLVMGPDAVSAIFYVLGSLYFGCIILTPEKVPLNALDFILLAFICFLSIMSKGYSEFGNVQQIAMKAVLLGLALNLIYSRISRNRNYIVFLACLLCMEALIIALVQIV